MVIFAPVAATIAFFSGFIAYISAKKGYSLYMEHKAPQALPQTPATITDKSTAVAQKSAVVTPA